MVLSAVIRISANSFTTFAIKNSFCVIALEGMRKSLQQVFTEVITPSLGSYVAPIVGMQLGTMCAIPVTLFVGEIVAKAVREVVSAVSRLFKRILYGLDTTKKQALFRELVFGCASFAIGFFAKIYFCNYGMGTVGTCLRIGAKIAAPLPLFSAPVVAYLATPTVTLIAGDIIGQLATNTSYELFQHCYDFLTRSKKKT